MSWFPGEKLRVERKDGFVRFVKLQESTTPEAENLLI
jgi:hypothetical protein